MADSSWGRAATPNAAYSSDVKRPALGFATPGPVCDSLVAPGNPSRADCKESR